MAHDFYDLPGVGSFWEDADRDDSAENPLERELCERLDACARYRLLIAEALANGREEHAELLLSQHDREVDQVRRLRRAIDRLYGTDAA